MRKVKKQPMRMCIGCREMRPKRDLIRVVRTLDGSVEVDPTGKKSGRGAYVCPSADCVEAAVKGGRFERCFHQRPTPEVISRIREEIAKE